MIARRALVTGGSRGIGFAIVKCLEAKGLEVIAPTRRDMDLLSDSSIDSFINRLNKPIDIVINNAGINLIAVGTEVTDSNITDTVQVNLLAPLRIIRALIPPMVTRQYGRIVNISSIWGFVTKEGRLTYSMTKSGLGGMTRTLAVELAHYNILVNVIAPGYVNTELTRQNNTKGQIESIEKAIPIGRLANPDEIAEAVAFFASDSNTYITGQQIIIDGGYTCL